MATFWKFHKGIRTIGGTVIEIDADGYRLVFDMGRGFEPGSVVFDHELKPRGIRDLRRLGVAPAVNGIFAGDGSRDDRPTMIAVSHMHLDHMGFFPYLRADVPVLMSEDSHRLLQALDAVHDGPRTPLDIRPVAINSVTSWGPFAIECVAAPERRHFLLQRAICASSILRTCACTDVIPTLLSTSPGELTTSNQTSCL